MVDPVVNEHQAQWLSMVRYQTLVARQQSSAPAPLSSLALNTMQDAAESMLKLCGEQLGADIGTRDDFDTMLGKVASKTDAADNISAYASSLRAMNRARVNFKHNGNRADDSTVRQHMDSVQAAISALSLSVFGIELNAVSLLMLVSNAAVRARLQTAQDFRASGEHAESMADLAQAFHELLGDYERRKSSRLQSIYSNKPPFVPTMPKHDDPFRLTYEWLGGIDEQLRVLSMGVDPLGYTFFRAHMPRLMQFLDGGFGANFPGQEVVPLDDDTWGRCLRFVIETSLRLDANDFDVPGKPTNGSVFLRRTAEENMRATSQTLASEDGVA
jgi:hypothetical protein